MLIKYEYIILLSYLALQLIRLTITRSGLGFVTEEKNDLFILLPACTLNSLQIHHSRTGKLNLSLFQLIKFSRRVQFSRYHAKMGKGHRISELNSLSVWSNNCLRQVLIKFFTARLFQFAILYYASKCETCKCIIAENIFFRFSICIHLQSFNWNVIF